jgi:hypothetical protein
MLGHASAATTLDVYADLFDDDLDSVSLAPHEARARSIESASIEFDTSREVSHEYP